MMEQAFRLIDDPDGESTYLRLSTRAIRQVERADKIGARARWPAAIGCGSPAPAPRRQSLRWAR